MASDDKSAAEKFADHMGDAAQQLKDALLKVLELYNEQQEKLRKASLEEQAAIKKQFSKTLQAEGFEASDENIAILQEHGAKIDAAQEEVGGLKNRLKEFDDQNPGQLTKELDEERAGLEKQLAGAETKLGKLNEGEGLEMLKPDSAKNALKVFKANSVGAEMSKKNALSDQALVAVGAKQAQGQGINQPATKLRAGTV